MEIKKIGKYIWRGTCVVLAMVALIVLSMLGYFWGSFECHWWGKDHGYNYSKSYGKNVRYLYEFELNCLWESRYNGIVEDAKGRKLLKDVQWVKIEDGDSIAVFAQKGYRGYLNVNTGKVLVPATKYRNAYVYSEGRAVALTQDSIYILDPNGKVVGSPFARYADSKRYINMFHNGYLPMMAENGSLGFINTNAEWAEYPVFDEITRLSSHLWLAKMESKEKPDIDHCVIYDDSLNIRLEGLWTYVEALNNSVVVADANHWQRRYSLDGDVLDEFVCSTIEHMTYTTGETQLVTLQSKGEYDDGVTITTEDRNVTGVASLMKYAVSTGYEGLMTKDCVPLTPPLYWNITAISKDRFFCTYSNDSSVGVVLDEKGRVVK